jgi:hypothetical protein
MKRSLWLLADYFRNAYKSSMIGVLVAVAVALARGRNSLLLVDIGAYALIGAACGTCSKAAIEAAFSLLGRRPILAYVLNAVVIAAVITLLVYALFGDFAGLEPWLVALIFILPEVVSVLLVRAGIGEATRLERAFEKRRDRFDSDGEN